MIEKMAMGLVDQMAEEKMIDKEAEEYYVYTLVSLMEKFITIGTILLISVLIEKLVPTAFFLLFFLSLRKRTGGYHMNTFFQCYLGTVVTYMLVLGLCMVLVDYPQLVFGLLLVAICIVEVIGTVNHPNIHMDAVELSESKRAARILCAVEVCVIYTFTLLGADMMYVCHMAVAVILCAVLLLIAKILKQEVKRNEEDIQQTSCCNCRNSGCTGSDSCNFCKRCGSSGSNAGHRRSAAEGKPGDWFPD